MWRRRGGCRPGRRRQSTGCAAVTECGQPGGSPPADQRGRASGAYGRGRVPGAPGRFPEAGPGCSRVHPGVWPCARTCALARPRRRRLHGCCVDRPAVLDTGAGGYHRPIPRGRWTGPGGVARLPDRGFRVPRGRSTGVCRACGGSGGAARQSVARTGRNTEEQGDSSPPRRFPFLRRLAGSRRSDEVGSSGARTFPPPLAPTARDGRKRAVHAERVRGTQRPESVPPLATRATRAGRSRAGCSGGGPAAFARGACAHDVRRP